LGSLDGVYATAAKWRDGLEVVSVLYDPMEIGYQTLLKNAKRFKCTDKVFAHSKQQLNVAKRLVGDKAVMVSDSQESRFAKKSDQKYYLANSPLRSLPMCDYQITKINAAIGMKKPFQEFLSPRQSNQKALEGLVTPIDDNKLGQYAAKLEEALAK